MNQVFYGFPRPVGRAGIRNKILLLPIDRYSNEAAWQIDQTVAGLTRFTCPGDMGRHAGDRERLFSIMRGVAANPNVAGVVLISVNREFNYPETRAQRLLDALAALEKPVVPLFMSELGGAARTVVEGQIAARNLLREIGRQQRCPVPLGELSIGIKCGTSDGTSGISGNPALGAAMDRLVAANGTVIFSETTEIIGAEQVLAERAADAQTAERIVCMARRVERQARDLGEDIRTINPIPSNIKAGISTLEEKSLGAIAKGGTTPLCGALDYAQAPDRRGLFFMDGWMASNSLPISLAAAGAQITVLQSGGSDLPDDPPLAATNPGLVAPNFYMSGNPELVAKMRVGLDFDSSAVLVGDESLADIGARILQALSEIASGQPTYGETLKYSEVQEIWFDGPVF
ncbi:UxaA family hydrolase [Salinisphaera sp. T31B1]|uniref:UxaA family hydrolase n=1 Tax=Salinisphaera sp. T31B1 TaxID=727963 RepID=UPI0033402BB3